MSRNIDLLPLPRLPEQPGTAARWGQLYGSGYSFLLRHTAEQHAGLVVLLTESVQNAARLANELQFFAEHPDYRLFNFPDWETLPYDHFSPHPDIVSERLLSLYELPQLQQGMLILPALSVMQRLAPIDYIQHYVFSLQTGQRLDIESFRQDMHAAGYQHVSQVMEHGEFSVRGSIIDIFPMGSEQPLRIDLLDDEIDSIRHFDPGSQRSLQTVAAWQLLPAHEYPLNEIGIKRFRSQYRDRFSGNPQNNSLYKDISNGLAPAGCEYYLPLFFQQCATLFDYLPENTLLITEDGVEPALNEFWTVINNRYEQYRHDIERPILRPDELYLSPEQVLSHCAVLPRIEVQRFSIDTETSADAELYNFPTQAPPALRIEPHAEQPSAKLQAYLTNTPGRILFVCESTGRREVLLDLLRNIHVFPEVFDSWQAFLHSSSILGITVGPISEGMLLHSDSAAQNKSKQLNIISETQLFGERAQQSRRRKTRGRDAEAIVSSLTDLTIGAPVVHEEHGVGRYLGLQNLAFGGNPTEFLVLQYADDDKLFVPVASLDLISRYSGAAAEQAPLHKLGGEQWQRAKRKAAKQIRDVAAELLDIYAQRAARHGHAFHSEPQQMLAFASEFPFEETPDQQQAIDAVVNDMSNSQPMDRVVCGDVGFGKTEVAMRASFAAVQGQKQVAILVPTTLLAQQHYQNFLDRFADWPVRVESLSRFNTAKQQQTVIEALADGRVDIVIGTHKLLQKNIQFCDLGLVIIDEEHRFGVRHKERLKSLRAEVDVLTLTATPIPRTLNMAISGLRDLSIIATPPARRNAIKTFVNQWHDALLQEACQRELKRGGQIYFVHNQVQGIEKIAQQLQNIVPEARIGIAHGQLPERELEKIMLDFYHQRFNLLVCTTIIESGIDVPTANTIIINRADRFGLAQLHQLRGRVGRSHHRAYAYLLAPPSKALTADAKKRLQAIESLEDLGAGFTLASHDLEIRGAGELLGDEQSGQIQEIGYSLYTSMLEQAVTALKQGEEPLLDKPMHSGCEIDMGVPALLPADYIYDVHSRLVIYKRISNAQSSAELRDLQVELIDRFGLLPEAAKLLFAIAETKLTLKTVGIRKIQSDLHSGFIEFNDAPTIAPERLIQLLQSQPQRYSFDGKHKLQFKHTASTAEQQLDFVQNILLNELRHQNAA